MSNTLIRRNQAVEQIRSSIDHPVIDGDGHHLEFMPGVLDVVKQIGGAETAQRLIEVWSPQNFDSRRGLLPVRGFFGFPAENTLDLMTAFLPNLLYQRLDEFGIDFALMYPSRGLGAISTVDDEARRVASRAMNTYYAQVYEGYRDRLEPVAVIPTFTPEEAIEELDYAVAQLGLKSIVMNGTVPRTVRPDGTAATWIDTLCHDSLYDYDPVWAKCQELKVVPTFHGLGYGWGSRVSSTNYVYNHLGNFAASQEAICRSVLMGGVANRFPDLKFVFLEGGCGWAAQLFLDVIGHFEKRNSVAIKKYDPSRIDFDLLTKLMEEFAPESALQFRQEFVDGLRAEADTDPGETDDFRDTGIESVADIVDIFTNQFAFGCEADDPMNALAFSGSLLPDGSDLKALFASDIGHWDVADMRDVLVEAWELVEHEHVDPDQFRAFTYSNVREVLTSVNPEFFHNTVID